MTVAIPPLPPIAGPSQASAESLSRVVAEAEAVRAKALRDGPPVADVLRIPRWFPGELADDITAENARAAALSAYNWLDLLLCGHADVMEPGRSCVDWTPDGPVVTCVVRVRVSTP